MVTMEFDMDAALENELLQLAGDSSVFPPATEMLVDRDAASRNDDNDNDADPDVDGDSSSLSTLSSSSSSSATSPLSNYSPSTVSLGSPAQLRTTLGVQNFNSSGDARISSSLADDAADDDTDLYQDTGNTSKKRKREPTRTSARRISASASNTKTALQSPHISKVVSQDVSTRNDAHRLNSHLPLGPGGKGNKYIPHSQVMRRSSSEVIHDRNTGDSVPHSRQLEVELAGLEEDEDLSLNGEILAVRKEVHLNAEKRRRKSLNNAYDNLRSLVPHCGTSQAIPKTAVLSKAVAYIQDLCLYIDALKAALGERDTRIKKLVGARLGPKSSKAEAISSLLQADTEALEVFSPLRGHARKSVSGHAPEQHSLTRHRPSVALSSATLASKLHGYDTRSSTYAAHQTSLHEKETHAQQMNADDYSSLHASNACMSGPIHNLEPSQDATPALGFTQAPAIEVCSAELEEATASQIVPTCEPAGTVNPRLLLQSTPSNGTTSVPSVSSQAGNLAHANSNAIKFPLAPVIDLDNTDLGQEDRLTTTASAQDVQVPHLAWPLSAREFSPTVALSVSTLSPVPAPDGPFAAASVADTSYISSSSTPTSAMSSAFRHFSNMSSSTASNAPSFSISKDSLSVQLPTPRNSDAETLLGLSNGVGGLSSATINAIMSANQPTSTRFKRTKLAEVQPKLSGRKQQQQQQPRSADSASLTFEIPTAPLLAEITTPTQASLAPSSQNLVPPPLPSSIVASRRNSEVEHILLKAQPTAVAVPTLRRKTPAAARKQAQRKTSATAAAKATDTATNSPAAVATSTKEAPIPAGEGMQVLRSTEETQRSHTSSAGVVVLPQLRNRLVSQHYTPALALSPATSLQEVKNVVSQAPALAQPRPQRPPRSSPLLKEPKAPKLAPAPKPLEPTPQAWLAKPTTVPAVWYPTPAVAQAPYTRVMQTWGNPGPAAMYPHAATPYAYAQVSPHFPLTAQQSSPVQTDPYGRMAPLPSQFPYPVAAFHPLSQAKTVGMPPELCSFPSNWPQPIQAVPSPIQSAPNHPMARQVTALLPHGRIQTPFLRPQTAHWNLSQLSPTKNAFGSYHYDAIVPTPGMTHADAAPPW